MDSFPFGEWTLSAERWVSNQYPVSAKYLNKVVPPLALPWRVPATTGTLVGFAPYVSKPNCPNKHGITNRATRRFVRWVEKGCPNV